MEILDLGWLTNVSRVVSRTLDQGRQSSWKLSGRRRLWGEKNNHRKETEIHD
jgi:hypothetical protein